MRSFSKISIPTTNTIRALKSSNTQATLLPLISCRSYSARKKTSRGLATISTNPTNRNSSNPPMSFPCLDKLEKRTESLQSSKPSASSVASTSYESGPEPAYSNISTGYSTFHSAEPLYLDNGGVLPEFDIAYETWGELNSDKSNAILIHTGLSASSHAKSHPLNPKSGWWEKFIGPGLSIDTNKFFVICTNVIGGCYGSTGPSSLDPSDNKRYATRFPIVTINDMVRAQNDLIKKHLKIDKLYASIGASMGGMQSLAYSTEFPNQVGKVVSISGCARSHPYSIAMRHTQRQVLMADPNWKRGFYYDSVPPHVGMKLAREIATITYRSGPEWEMRFGRDRADPSKKPALCPDFLIETYLDHQGEKFCLEYDANSLLYVSKAMDLFDMGKEALQKAETIRKASQAKALEYSNEEDSICSLPSQPYMEQPRQKVAGLSKHDLVEGLRPMSSHEVLVLGVDSDILFPSWQQKEIADVLKEGSKLQGNVNADNITYIELGQDISLFGHDTFLLDVEHVGLPMKRFLEN